ncbi:helix-turn-helix transcriptional regulator [Streptomyces flaveolus]|uniref:helix-turn-helix transcriptional regulator n=1 Tax=Streptomyces flaveolus TaxID=67297 RepID=UPI0037022B8C
MSVPYVHNTAQGTTALAVAKPDGRVRSAAPLSLRGTSDETLPGLPWTARCRTPGRSREVDPQPSDDPRRTRPVLRGRRPEMAVLTTLLDKAEHGAGSVLVIEGVPGSGKTRLLDEARLAATHRGLRVLHGSAAPEGYLTPLSPLLDAFSSGTHPLLDVRTLTAIADLPDPNYWTLQEIQSRLERAATTAPLVVAVDDVQWCDETSLLALRKLPERLTDRPVVWLLTVRALGVPGPARATVSQLLEAGGLHIRLGPLDTEAVKDIAGDAFGAVPDNAIVNLAAPAQGRPLFLWELFQELHNEGFVTVRSGQAHLTGTPAPWHFTQSVRRRLSHLSTLARGLAEAASALGSAYSAGLLAELLGVPSDSVTVPLRELMTTGLVEENHGTLVFPHDLVREAVAGQVTPARRQWLRRRAVDVRLAAGARVTDIAASLSHSAEPGDRAAVGLLTEAAAELASRAPAAAADLNDRAVRLLSERDPARPQMTAETITLLRRGGKADQALALAETAFWTPGGLSPESEARLRLDLSELAGRQSLAEAIRQGRLGVAVEGVPDGLRALQLARLSMHLLESGAIPEAHRTAERAQTLARSTGQSAAEAMALIVESAVAYARGNWERAHGAADRAVLCSQQDDVVETPYRPAMWRAALRSRCGQVQQAAQEVDEELRLARDHGQATAMHLWSVTRSRVLLAAGRLEEARAEAEGALTMAQDLYGSAYPVDNTLRYVLGIVALHTGDRMAIHTAASDAARMMNDEAISVSRLGAWLAARTAEWEGDSQRALKLLPRTMEQFDKVRPETRILLDPMDQPTYVRIALRAGDRRRAANAAAAARRRAEANPAFPGLAAAAAHAHGLLELDAERILESARLFRASSRPLAAASATEDAAHALASTSPVRAMRYLEKALAEYEKCGANWHAERVRCRLIAAGKRGKQPVRTPGLWTRWDDLSPGELRVVGLIAAGKTDREIADRLSVSPHAIRTFVQRAYRVLEISSRAELIRLATQQSGPGAVAS